MTETTMTLMTGFLSFLYPMQLVTPSVVATTIIKHPTSYYFKEKYTVK